MKSRRYQAVIPSLALTVALLAPPAHSIEPTTTFLLGVATTATAYHYRVNQPVRKVYRSPATMQRKVEATFPSYALTRANMRSSRTKYLRLPRMRGHICGHDGFCLGN